MTATYRPMVELPIGFAPYRPIFLAPNALKGWDEKAGQPIYGPVFHRYQEAYIADTPDGGHLLVTPGSREDLTTHAGYYLTKEAADGTFEWGQRFSNVEAALSIARAELRALESHNHQQKLMKLAEAVTR